MSHDGSNPSIRTLHAKDLPYFAAAAGGASKKGATSILGKSSSARLGPTLRWNIISSYGRILDKCSSPVERESDLPFSKDLIRRAICEELSENPDGEVRAYLEIAYAQLEAFVSSEEFEVIQSFKDATGLLQEKAYSADPLDVIASARILKSVQGERAVRIQERISEKMSLRLKQARSIRMGASLLPFSNYRSAEGN